MIIKQKENSNWKEKASQSKHLKDYYKNNKDPKHPVFGEVPRRHLCQKCGTTTGKTAEFTSHHNGKLEWAYCRQCYGQNR